MSKFVKLVVAFQLATFPATASAWQWGGNPTVNLRIDRSGNDLLSADAYVKKVRVHYCNGGGHADYPVNQTLDLEAGHDLTIVGGDICGVSVDWDSDVLIDHTSWLAEYSNLYTSVQISGPGDNTTPLMNLEILEGSFSGSDPRLIVNID